MAARQTAPVLGALCSSSSQDRDPRRRETEEAEIGPRVSDQERLTSREVYRPRLWIVNIGYRFQPSSRHFVGTVEQKQREILGNQIQNTYHLFDVSVERILSRRWSVTGSVPIFFAYRNQLYNPRGEFRVRSIGDMTMGGRAWLFRPPPESGANVSLGMSLKLPTGKYGARGWATNAQGNPVYAVADQSIQAGDGGVGFAVDLQAFQPIPWRSMLYFTGTYLFNPRDTNGIPTFRSRPSEAVMSVSDQYLARGGVSRPVPKVPGLFVAFGGRIEGVPVRDLLGKSNGFRRPGYAISADPGFLYARGLYVFSVSVPFALERNRRRSVPDIQDGRHGDAAFADYTLVIGVSRRF